MSARFGTVRRKRNPTQVGGAGRSSRHSPQIAVRFDRETMDALSGQAHALRRPVAMLIREAVAQWLADKRRQA